MAGSIPASRCAGSSAAIRTPTAREPSGFEDGLTNPRVGGAVPDNAEQFVYVQPGDDEPDWCVHGSYLAYRKIRRRLTQFFKLDDAGRAAVFGIDARTGQRLPGAKPHAHAQKINPRREGHRDLFGRIDTDRRFLRRPYFFDDGTRRRRRRTARRPPYELRAARADRSGRC